MVERRRTSYLVSLEFAPFVCPCTGSEGVVWYLMEELDGDRDRDENPHVALNVLHHPNNSIPINYRSHSHSRPEIKGLGMELFIYFSG